jgi:hypothetical protein
MKQSRKKLLINSILLGAGLLIIMLYYILKALPDQKQKENLGKHSLIADKEKSDFLSIDVQYRDENGFIHRTRLSNESGTWMVTLPLYKKANQGRVNEMMDALLGIRSETNYSGLTQSQLSNYGIFRPNDIFSFRFKDGSYSAIVNGNISKTENYYYSYLPEQSNSVYVVYAYKYSAAELTTSQLLEKQIFTDNIADIQSFSVLALDGKNYHITANGKNWKLISPVIQAADSYAVKKRLLNIYSLHILEYLKFDRSPQDLRVLGLDRPKYRITTSTAGQKMEIMVSEVTNKFGYFAYSPRIPGIFVLKAEDVLKTFNLSTKEFQVTQE